MLMMVMVINNRIKIRRGSFRLSCLNIFNYGDIRMQRWVYEIQSALWFDQDSL